MRRLRGFGRIVMTRAADFAPYFAYAPPSDRLFEAFLDPFAEAVDAAGIGASLVADLATLGEPEPRTRCRNAVRLVLEAARDPARKAGRPLLLVALHALAAGHSAVWRERQAECAERADSDRADRAEDADSQSDEIRSAAREPDYDEIDLRNAVAGAIENLERLADLEAEEYEIVGAVHAALDQRSVSHDAFAHGVLLLEALSASLRKARALHARLVRSAAGDDQRAAGARRERDDALLAFSGRTPRVPTITVTCPELAILLGKTPRAVQEWAKKVDFPAPRGNREGKKAPVFSLGEVVTWYARTREHDFAEVSGAVMETLNERGDEPVLADVRRQVDALHERLVGSANPTFVREGDVEAEDGEGEESEEYEDD